MKINFTKTHEWLAEKDGKFFVGISDYAQDQLGDIVFINLPEINAEIKCGEAFCDIESVKAVSDVNSPCCGKIIAVNEELLDHPELINEKPYESWIAQVEVYGTKDLLTQEEYEAFIKE